MDDLLQHIASLRFDRAAGSSCLAPSATVAAPTRIQQLGDAAAPSTVPKGLPGIPHQSDFGAYQWIRQPLADFVGGFHQFEKLLQMSLANLRSTDTPVVHPAVIDKGVYFDLETCGFSGSPLFLIGLIRCDGTEWILEQLLARDYEEEAGVLGAFLARLSPDTVLVSFNGKSFDYPFVVDRLARHRMPLAPELPHVDLLHVARRQWAGRFENFRLQTLEAGVCRRRRVADLGGRDVAIAYHEYVRSGQLRDVRRILQHNALDVLTMLELTVALTTPGT